jgi:hypothetical protein
VIIFGRWSLWAYIGIFALLIAAAMVVANRVVPTLFVAVAIVLAWTFLRMRSGPS